MSGLTMPKKGEAARLLADLNAEHANPKEAQPERTSEESNERYNVTTLQDSLKESQEESSVARNVSGNVPAQAIDNAESHASSSVSALKEPRASASKETVKGSNASSKGRISERGEANREREEGLEKAMQIALGDELDVATIRVSSKLHNYLERYVERINRINPKAKYRKQDAVLEAFAAFFADHPMPPAPVEEEL